MGINSELVRVSREARLLFYFLREHEYLTPVGTIRISHQTLAAQIRMEPAELNAAMLELAAASFIRFDGDFIWIVRHMDTRPPDNPNIVKKCRPEHFPPCPMREAALCDILTQLKERGANFFRALAVRIAPLLDSGPCQAGLFDTPFSGLREDCVIAGRSAGQLPLAGFGESAGAFHAGFTGGAGLAGSLATNLAGDQAGGQAGSGHGFHGATGNVAGDPAAAMLAGDGVTGQAGARLRRLLAEASQTPGAVCGKISGKVTDNMSGKMSGKVWGKVSGNVSNVTAKVSANVSQPIYSSSSSEIPSSSSVPVFQMACRKGKYIVTPAQFLFLREHFPSLELERELHGICAWLETYPRKRPQKDEMYAYISNCLNRAVRRRSGGASMADSLGSLASLIPDWLGRIFRPEPRPAARPARRAKASDLADIADMAFGRA